MSGAVGLTLINASYFAEPNDPRYTVKQYLDHFHVCERKYPHSKRKDIIAVFNLKKHANIFVQSLEAKL